MSVGAMSPIESSRARIEGLAPGTKYWFSPARAADPPPEGTFPVSRVTIPPRSSRKSQAIRAIFTKVAQWKEQRMGHAEGQHSNSRKCVYLAYSEWDKNGCGVGTNFETAVL